MTQTSGSPRNPGRFTQQLRDRATNAASRPDAKAKAILEWLEAHIRPNGKWSDARVILFTEYRATQQWLHEILVTHGFGGDGLALIFGGMDPEERERIKASFQASPAQSPLRILLATDAASEGIDLQNHCNLMIHVEIPYNPNVMEQRNGRIDRHGQAASEVVIWHPVDANGTHSEDILRALRKLDDMRADMGSVNPVIAPQLPELLEGRRKTLETAVAEARLERSRRFVKAERELRERIERLHDQLVRTREEQHLSPEHVERAVRIGLLVAEKPALREADLEGAPEGRVFEMPALSGSWARCLEGLEHPYTGNLRPITFDHEVARGQDDVVLVHLNHRLVQMCLRVLRAELWAGDDVKKLSRVTVRSVSEGLEGPAVVVLSRLVITGGNHHRLHEEPTETGGALRDDGFRREPRVGVVRDWLAASSPARLKDATLDALRTRFERSTDAIRAAVEARSKERLRNLANTIERRKARETEDIRQVLGELEAGLRAELEKDEEPEQLELLDDRERTQLRRDRAALEARLARIPAELEEEVRAIEERYSGTMERTFPAAVVLLIPESLAEGGGS